MKIGLVIISFLGRCSDGVIYVLFSARWSRAADQSSSPGTGAVTPFAIRYNYWPFIINQHYATISELKLRPPLLYRGTNPFATVKLRPTTTNDRSAPRIH